MPKTTPDPDARQDEFTDACHAVLEAAKAFVRETDEIAGREAAGQAFAFVLDVIGALASIKLVESPARHLEIVPEHDE